MSFDLAQRARAGRVHFMGISGAGMSALAEWVRRTGGHVDGCDAAPTEVAGHLRALGIAVERGHDPSHIEGAEGVVYTAAVPRDHPELAAARAAGIPVARRSVALASVVNAGTAVAVSGTHGKTTTTAMATAILEESGHDPTAFVGGTVAAWGSGLRHGADRLFVVEADEYDRAFLTLRPHVAVVTSIEPDHLDIYGSLENVLAAFGEFVAAVPADGLIVACSDDGGARTLLDGRTRTLSFGTGEDATLRATAITMDGDRSRFDLSEDGRSLGTIEVGVPGVHNVRNALGAFAAARHVGADFAAAERALRAFRGVGRRFERLDAGEGIVVIDDYAHHPTEIAATLDTARRSHPGRRIVAAFQPHLFSRTRDFATAFGAALAAADEIWLTEIYPAREAPIEGVTAALIAAAARDAGAERVRMAPELEGLSDGLVESLREGDVLVAMGAGTIDSATRAIARRLRERARAS